MTRQDFKLLLKSFEYATKYKLKLLWVILLAFLEMCSDLVVPLLWGILIQQIVTDAFNKVYIIVSILGALYILEAIVTYYKTSLSYYIEENIGLDLKRRIFKKSLNFKMKILDNLGEGDVLSRLDGDVPEIASIFTGQFLNFLLNLSKTIVVGVIIFKINIFMALVVLISFPLSYGVLYIFSSKLKQENMKSREISDKFYSYTQESISNIREVKGLGIKKVITSGFNKISTSDASVNINIGKVTALSNSSIILIDFLSQIAIYAIGIYLMSQGQLKLEFFIAVSSYAIMLADSLLTISQINPSLQAAIVSLKRIYEIISAGDDIQETFGNNEVSEKTNHIIFKSVYFKYDKHYVLKDIDFSFNENGKYALVGESGSGKTTILDLLLKIYEPNQGDIFLNNMNILSLTEESLRKNITIVQQQPSLFKMSILDNLRLDNVEIQFSQIKKVCESVNIAQFIEGLPQGYNTILSDEGNDLSVGQRQRIALARALLQDTNIILFDEILSSQDSISKKIITETIDKLRKERMVIIIEHRLQNIIDADQIVVLRSGKIESIGVHEVLIDTCDYYKQLYCNEVDNEDSNKCFI